MDSILTRLAPEVRFLIYAEYFNPILKVHATENVRSGECRQLSFMDRQTHLALLRTCKLVAREATAIMFRECQFHIADCNCFSNDGKIPAIARTSITTLVCPPSASGRAFLRLQRLLQHSDLISDDLSEHYIKRLTYLTIFSIDNRESDDAELKKTTPRGPAYNLSKIVALTHGRVRELRCWLKDASGRLSYAQIDGERRVTIFNTRNIDLQELKHALQTQYTLFRDVKVIVPSLEWTIENLDATVPAVTLS